MSSSTRTEAEERLNTSTTTAAVTVPEEDFSETETAAGAMSLLASTMSAVKRVRQRLVAHAQEAESLSPTPVDSHLDPSSLSGARFPGPGPTALSSRHFHTRTQALQESKDIFLTILSEQLNDIMLNFEATTALGQPGAQSSSSSAPITTVSNAEILYALERDLDWLDRLVHWWLTTRPTVAKHMEFFYRSCVQNMRLIDAYSTALDIVPTLDLAIREERRLNAVPAQFKEQIEAIRDVHVRIPTELIIPERDHTGLEISLGVGGQGAVRMATLFGDVVALKEALDSQLDATGIVEEGKKMLWLRHQGICPLYGFRVGARPAEPSANGADDSDYILSPRVQQGERVDGILLQRLGRPLSERITEKSLSFPKRLTYAVQLTKALRYLHCSSERDGKLSENQKDGAESSSAGHDSQSVSSSSSRSQSGENESADATSNSDLREPTAAAASPTPLSPHQEKMKYIRSLFVRKTLFHSDIKAANAAETICGRCVKWLDFGSAFSVEDLKGDVEVTGSSLWMAPELLFCQSGESGLPSPESEVYSLGMTFLELLTGDVPWGEEGRNATNVAVKRLKDRGWNIGTEMRPLAEMEGLRFDPANPDDPNLSAGTDGNGSRGMNTTMVLAFQKLICDCTQTDPKERPSLSDVLARVQRICVKAWLNWKDDLLSDNNLPQEEKSAALRECFRELRRLPECPPHCWTSRDYPPRFRPNLDEQVLLQTNNSPKASRESVLLRVARCLALGTAISVDVKRCRLHTVDVLAAECQTEAVLQKLVGFGAAFQHNNVLRFLGFSHDRVLSASGRETSTQGGDNGEQRMISGWNGEARRFTAVFEALPSHTRSLATLLSAEAPASAGDSSLSREDRPLTFPELLDAIEQLAGFCEYLALDVMDSNGLALRWDPTEFLRSENILMFPVAPSPALPAGEDQLFSTAAARVGGANRFVAKGISCTLREVDSGSARIMREADYVRLLAGLICDSLFQQPLSAFLANRGASMQLPKCVQQDEATCEAVIPDVQSLVIRHCGPNSASTSTTATLHQFRTDLQRVVATAWVKFGYQMSRRAVPEDLTCPDVVSCFLEAAKFPLLCDSLVWETLGDSLEGAATTPYDRDGNLAASLRSLGSDPATVHDSATTRRVTLLNGDTLSRMECYAQGMACASHLPRYYEAGANPALWLKMGTELLHSDLEQFKQFNRAKCFQKCIQLAQSPSDSLPEHERFHLSRAFYGLGQDAEKKGAQTATPFMGGEEWPVPKIYSQAITFDPKFGAALFELGQSGRKNERCKFYHQAILAEPPHSNLAKKAWVALKELLFPVPEEKVQVPFDYRRCVIEAEWEDPRLRECLKVHAEKMAFFSQRDEANRAKLEAVNAARGSLFLEKDDLLKELHAARKAKKETERKLSASERKEKDLQEVVAATRAEIAAAQKLQEEEIEKLVHQQAEQERQIQQLHSTAEERAAALEKEQHHRRMTEAQQKELGAAIAALQQEKSGLEVSIATLKRSLETKQEVWQAMDTKRAERCSQLEAQLESELLAKADIERKMVQAQRECEDLQQRLKSRIAEDEGRAHSLTQQESESSTALREAKQALADSERKISSLEGELQKNIAAQSELLRAELKIRTLEDQLSTATKSLDAALETRMELEALNCELQGNIALKEEQLALARNGERQLKEVQVDLEQRLGTAIEAESKRTAELKDYQDRLKEASREISIRNAKILALRQNIEVLSAENFTLRSRTDELSEARADVELAMQEKKAAEDNQAAAELKLRNVAAELEDLQVKYKWVLEDQKAAAEQREGLKSRIMDLAKTNAQLQERKSESVGISLLSAVYNNDVKTCQLICNTRPEELAAMWFIGMDNGRRQYSTALLEAIKRNYVELVLLFLQPTYAAYVDLGAATATGETPFILAAKSATGEGAILSLLTRAIRGNKYLPGKEEFLNRRDASGRTVLHYIASNRNLRAPGKFCNVLKGYGANVTLEDNDRQNALAVALKEQPPPADSEEKQRLHSLVNELQHSST